MRLGVCVGRVILALALLIAPVGVNAQSGPALWRFADPNAKSAIGIDWAQIRNSPAGAMLREKLSPQGALPWLPALSLLDSIDRVLISSPTGPAAEGSDGNGGNDDSENAAILIAIEGRFDAANVRQIFVGSGAKAQSYNSFQVFRPQAKKNRDSAFVLYDAHTILYGDAPLVFAALDRNGFGPPAGPAPKPGSLPDRAAELDAKYELWAVLDVAEVASSDTLAALFQGNEWASAVQGIEAGVNLGAGLDADFVLRFASDETAKHVAADLAKVVTAAANNKSAGAEAQDVAKNLRFSVEGSAARVSLHMTKQELEQSARAFSTGVQLAEHASKTNPLAVRAPALAPAAPPKPATIRIEGLDEGTREIPYQQPEP